MQSGYLLRSLILSTTFLWLGAAKAEQRQVPVPELQYWIYTQAYGQLTFRFPWNKESEDDVQYEDDKLADYAKSCRQLALEAFQSTFQDAGISSMRDGLISKGATDRFIIIINVLSSQTGYQQLRRWDRDAYFWHWNAKSERPALALSDYRKGTWVWEVVSWPGNCIQPKLEEISRYLDYADKRLSHKS